MVKRAEAGGGPGSWGVRLEEVWRSEVMEGLESEEENLKVNAVLNREPEQLFEDRSDVFGGWGSDDNMGKRVLGQLVRLLMCFTKESVPSRMAPRLGHLSIPLPLHCQCLHPSACASTRHCTSPRPSAATRSCGRSSAPWWRSPGSRAAANGRSS